MIASDPVLTRVGDDMYAAGLAPSGSVWYNQFVHGSGNNWIQWISTGGVLSDVAAAGGENQPQLFLTGRDSANQLWWFETPGRGWVFVGQQGLAAGRLSAGPR